MSNTVKMHQILAVETDIRKTSNRRLTDVYQQLQKPALLAGMSRTYQPKDDEGDQLPSESQRVQVRASDALETAIEEFTRLWDIVATKDYGNMSTKADITLDGGKVLAEDVPVPYLLWLEKELNDLHTILSKLPTLDPAEDWTYDPERDVFVTEPVGTTKTKKIPKAFERSPATDKHPAQVDVFNEDVIVGTWTTTKFSGALPANVVRELVENVDQVRQAVKAARARANETEVDQVKIAGKILDHVFAPLKSTETAKG